MRPNNDILVFLACSNIFWNEFWPAKIFASKSVGQKLFTTGLNQSWNRVTFCDPVTRESSDPETQLTR